MVVKRNTSKGFSLMELMISVAIVGILASVAIPNYSQYVTRSNRTDAFDKLTEVMTQQQRSKTKNRTFQTNLANLGYAVDGNGDVLSDDGHYLVSAGNCTAGNTSVTRCIQVVATPVAGGRQSGDFMFNIDNRGNKQYGLVGGTLYTGWKPQ